MRHNPSALRVAVKASSLLFLAAGCVALLQSARKPTTLTTHDKAYYADQRTIDFVRPGLTLKVLAASIANDGTITTRFKITDPKGLGLDRDGVTTPGPVSVSFIAATIPAGQTQYVAYTTRIQTSPITGVSATQAGTDSGGTFAKVADGEYTYTFKTKAPSNFDKKATHSIGAYASRTLTEWNLPTNFDDDVFTFVPDGSAVTVTRDVIKTASCNRCHDQLAFHGGSRRSMELCVLCHTPQTTDPDTGNTVDMIVMTHKIHAGAALPSVQKGKPYQIIGFNQSVSDWSSVNFPADVRRCEHCHQQTTGAKQATNYLTKPSRTACGSCHDDVNFATGENHLNLPQISDNQCATCHVPQGELEFDASIKGAHVIIGAGTGTRAVESSMVQGINVDILKVDNGTAGKKPVVTFTVKDNAGKPITLASLKVTPNRIGLVLAGPTTDYGYTNFGSDVTTGGYVAEDASNGTCDASGTCTYTFTHAIPADAKGTYSIGVEARRGETLLAGTKKEASVEYGALNKVVNFSVDGSPLSLRRTVVDLAKCNECHGFLSLHGTNRNKIEQCVLCHNPSETDAARRPSAPAAEKAKPNQTVQFAYMIHRIHTGEKLQEDGADYTVIGFGGSVNDFTEVRYPVSTNTGGVADTTKCYMCHVNSSEGNLPSGKLAVKNPQGLIDPTPAVSAACLGCHASVAAASHALANTTRLGESCAACHGPNGDFSVAKAHAQ